MIEVASVPTEHEGGEGKHQRLESQNQGMHEPEGVYGVKHNTSHSAGVFGYDQIVIIGICVGDAAAAGCYIVEPAFVERLKSNKKGALPCHLLAGR
jgi:hypothetical protein